MTILKLFRSDFVCNLHCSTSQPDHTLVPEIAKHSGNYLTGGAHVARDPVRIVKAFFRYRWLSAYLIAPAMIDRWIEGDRGMALRCDLTAADCMISDSVETLWNSLRADRKLGETEWTEKTVAFDYTLPKHLIFGFPGTYAINMQQHAAFMLPLVETGVAVVGEYPDIGNFWMTTNNPCDANMMDNNAMYRELSANGKKRCIR